MIRHYASDVLNKLVHRSAAVTRSRNRSALAQALDHVTSARSELAPSALPPRPDPYTLLKPELTYVREALLNLLSSVKAHASLGEIAKFYFSHPSMQIRPLLVLLFARATNGLGEGWSMKHWQTQCEDLTGRTENANRPLTRSDALNDWDHNIPDSTTPYEPSFSHHAPKSPPLPPPAQETHVPRLVSPPLILSTQMRLAQILEMIHIASLLHYDITDQFSLRGSPPAAFGDKLSILGGDLLLARASAAVSRLGDCQVFELTASIIANFVEGEVLHIRGVDGSQSAIAESPRESWNNYIKKTYLKTASLMAKGARAAVVLGGGKEGEIWPDVAYSYGRNLGLAFQLVDDILDYESGEAALGKLRSVDWQLGLITGPVLCAWGEHSEMGPLIQRNFEQDGDVELARDYVRRSSGVERTRERARAYADKAKEVIQLLPDSDAKIALEVLTERVVQRTW